MTLNELLGLDAAEDPADHMREIILEVDEDYLHHRGMLLHEGTWQPSDYSDLAYRVDPAREEMRQKRHVHVAARKHTASKKKQVSWNADGTRHDAGSFNTKLGARADYQAVARAALRLPPGTILEAAEVSPAGHMVKLLEAIIGGDDDPLEPVKLTVTLPSEWPGPESTELDDVVRLGLVDCSAKRE